MAKPTLSIFTGSKGLGNIFQEQNSINVKYSEVNLPLTDTTGRLSANLLGKTRIIVIQASQDGEGFDGVTTEQKIGDFIFEMEEWINVNISKSKIFTDSFGNSYSVDAVDWQWTRSNDFPNRILYSLIMRED